jgi:hypothetical protein
VSADTQARVRVVEIYNEADELEGYGVIVKGRLHDTIFTTRSAAHNFRESMESILPIEKASR